MSNAEFGQGLLDATSKQADIRSYSDSERASLKRKASRLNITPTGIEFIKNSHA